MRKEWALAAAVASAAIWVGLASSATPPTKLSSFDRHFLAVASQNDRFEIESGAFALRRGGTKALCDLATRLITDHRRSSAELAAIAVRFHVSLPPSVTPLQQWALRQISRFTSTAAGATGTATGAMPPFGSSFSALQVAAHRTAIQEFGEATRLAESPVVRSFARSALPILRQHLQMAQNVGRNNQPATPGKCSAS
jgi:putative membrane protein